MGKRLRSIALIALATTLLSSIAQASPSGGAIKPKSDSTVCFDGHQNADYTFTCDQFIESHQWFENDIHNIQQYFEDKTLPVAQKAVFTLISYEAPYHGSYIFLKVNADGGVGSGVSETNGPSQGCKGCLRGTLNNQQVRQFEQKTNQLPLASQSERPKEIKGKTYTVILVQQHGTIVRRDYVDVLPPDLNCFVEETASLVENEAIRQMFGKKAGRNHSRRCTVC